jgi:hypothetical protein
MALRSSTLKSRESTPEYDCNASWMQPAKSPSHGLAEIVSPNVFLILRDYNLFMLMIHSTNCEHTCQTILASSVKGTTEKFKTYDRKYNYSKQDKKTNLQQRCHCLQD